MLSSRALLASAISASHQVCCGYGARLTSAQISKLYGEIRNRRRTEIDDSVGLWAVFVVVLFCCVVIVVVVVVIVVVVVVVAASI